MLEVWREEGGEGEGGTIISRKTPATARTLQRVSPARQTSRVTVISQPRLTTTRLSLSNTSPARGLETPLNNRFQSKIIQSSDIFIAFQLTFTEYLKLKNFFKNL